MTLNADDLNKIYYLTRTSMPIKRLRNLAVNFDSLEKLLEKINRLHYIDLDRDWTLFDYDYEYGKETYAKNIKIIEEKEIFKGTYKHTCKNSKKYLIQIIEKSGFCRRCDTQFFPKMWWNNLKKSSLNYTEIKYGKNIPRIPFEINKDYLKKLLSIKVDERILEEAISVIHSPFELEKILNIKFYDWNNPPPPSKIHYKLMLLKNIWQIKPVKNLGICPDSKLFFHKCANNVERILFQEKNFYSWCPSCFTKFIPQSDLETINLYQNMISVNGYVKIEEKINNAKHEINKNDIRKNSPEYYYLSVLGFEERCSIQEVTEAFRRLSKIYHPDFGGDATIFQNIVKAKKWLYKFYKHSIGHL